MQRTTSRSSRGLGRAFTLIELLVVVIIVGALIALTLAVGQGVVEGQRQRLAQDTIRVIDAAVDSYVRETGGGLPVLVEVPSPNPVDATDPTQNVLLPLADATDWTTASGEDDRVVINSVGLFVRALDNRGLGELLRPLEGEATAFFDPDESSGGNNRQTELRTILDPWGRPIRFVHPRFDGQIRQEPRSSFGDLGAPVDLTDPLRPLVTVDDLPEGFDASILTSSRFPIFEIRRNFLRAEDREAGVEVPGDSDGGICAGGRPYAYSAGPDGDPSTLDDNAYTTPPTTSQD